jgi:hypothetical protein
MSWLFSQALVAEYLGESSLDGEQSVPLSGKNTQLVYLPPDKMTEFSRLSRFGMMFKPLTESLGEELLMSYLADFHAKTSPQQERGGNYWKPKFNVEAYGENYWGNTTQILLCGKQPNAHF